MQETISLLDFQSTFMKYLRNNFLVQISGKGQNLGSNYHLRCLITNFSSKHLKMSIVKLQGTYFSHKYLMISENDQGLRYWRTHFLSHSTILRCLMTYFFICTTKICQGLIFEHVKWCFEDKPKVFSDIWTKKFVIGYLKIVFRG